jgi:hypothetical protein
MKALGQYMTPFWFAEALIERHFAQLGANDTVADLTCGTGAFLHAVPPSVSAFGVEIDAALAEQARQSSGRTVLTGDFRTIRIEQRPTAILGNPPFNMELVDSLLARAHELLPDGGPCGLILPTYALQTAGRVVRYSERWSIFQEMIPRQIYPRLSKSLLFAIFRKEQQRTLIGFAFYREVYDQQRFDAEYRAAMHAGAGVWRRVVAIAMRRLGGEARLPQIYAEIEGHRPTPSQYWREKIRQTLRVYANDFIALAPGHYRLTSLAA